MESDFSNFCQTAVTMKNIATVEAELSVPTRPVLDEMVTMSDNSVSFYSGIPERVR